MVDRDDLLEKFESILEVSSETLDEEVITKCMELCFWYHVDAEEFVDMWVAYGINHLDGNLTPTVKKLEEMKRATPRDKNKKQNTSLNKSSGSKDTFSKSSMSMAIADDDFEILGLYGATEKLAEVQHKQQTKRPVSPDLEDSEFTSGWKATDDDANSSSNTATSRPTPQSQQHLPSVPPSFSQSSPYPHATQTQTGGKTLMTFGSKIESWLNLNNSKYPIRRAGSHVPANERYMFELLKAVSDVRTRVCRQVGFQICTTWAAASNGEDSYLTWNVRTRNQKKYRTWGRVCFESETKQSNPTPLLEGCRKPPKSNADTKFWPCVELDPSELHECSLFPGQIIAAEGINITGNLLKVQDIYKGSFIPAAKPPQIAEELKVYVAAGPFTQSNDLEFHPLWELLTKVAEEEPNVLILIGPFLDHSHPKVLDNSLTCTHQEFFNQLITRIKNYLTGKCTQVVLVASSRDVHHHAVYPTPEYFIPKSLQSSEILVLPDPCTIDIDGLRIGITSIDTLMHLGREEVVLKPCKTDKLSRLGNYILSQACFYPLYPPAKEINIDSQLWEKYAFLKEKPHMLLLPSDMRYFCKYINESVILNPERLSKRTFAKLNFKPCVDGSWTQENISCEVLKI
ncbi:hypothetical protein TKK_0006066 [Trichogramma kaykai]|uniref:DNA polymerase alpha subunit B n=1 Tax=Trichogramma kaykai TaxID=54128 RepID=A0ABD2XG50_9HYME